MSDHQNACPPWCVTDHGRRGPDGHSSRIAVVPVPGKVPGLADKFLVSGWQRDRHAPEVMITALRYGRVGEARDGEDPDMVLDLQQAARLAAALTGMLAGAAPEQHRELAAAIRAAIAGVAGEDAADSQD